MISVNNYNTPQVVLTGEDRRFIELINNRLTIYGQLPYTIPQKLIIELIKESFLYFCRMGYWRSQHCVFYRLPKKEIVEFLSYREQHSNDEVPCNDYPDCDVHEQHHIHPELVDKSYRNLRGYAVRLPSFINDIREIYRVNQDDMDTQEIFDASSDILLQQHLSPYGYSLLGINSNLYVYETTVKLTEQAAWHAVMSKSIPFHYNNANKTLIINVGLDDEEYSLMLLCDSNVDIQYMYVDDLYIKYVLARCKQELKRLIASHTLQLPGDTQLNAEEICARADEEISEVHEQLHGATGIGDLILQR